MSSELNARALLQEAEQSTGLRDWGGDEWHEREFRELMTILTESLEREANLHPRGRMAARDRLQNIFSGRLRLVDDRKRFPEIAREKITRPIIALGLPRAGTTFLHGLLAQDPAHRAPRTWEITFPSPPPEQERYDTDPRIALCQESLDRQGFSNPELLKIHPFGASLPDECIFIQEYSGTGPFAAFWNVPSYAAAASRVDFSWVFELHRRVLQHLQHRYGGARWVLKAPSHIEHVETLLSIYPDACFIQNHRDPIKVIPSIASTFVMLRRTFSDAAPDPRLIAQANIAMFAGPAMKLIELRKRLEIDAHFFDCHFTDLTREPIGMVKRLYASLDLSLSAEAARRMETWLEEDLHTKGSRHRYALEDYDLDEAELERHFGAYLDHYGIARERGARAAAQRTS